MPSIVFSFLFYYNFINPNKNTSEDIWITYSIMIILILWVILYLWNTLNYKLIITDQFIHLKSLFSDKKILVENIGNYKIDQYGLHIYTKSYSQSPSISITANLDNSEMLYLWLAHYSRNLEKEADLKAYEDELKEILHDDKYGKNKIEKEENIASVNKFINVLSGTAFILFTFVALGSFNIFPIPLLLLDIGIFATILIPILLVYFSLQHKGFFSVDEEANKTSRFPSIFQVLMFPSIALAVHWIFTGFYIFDSSTIWIYSLLISLFIILPIFFSARDISFKKIGDYFRASIAILFMLGYGYGTAAYLNYYFDKSEGQVYSVEVLNKEAGKDDDSAKQITLAPWFEKKEPQKVEVYQYLFNRVEKGDEVDIYLKEGYLGIKYYSIHPKQEK